MTDAPAFLKQSSGLRIAYRHVQGNGPTIIWCGGLKSDMLGSKAEFLAEWASQNHRDYIRFDYFGHGESDGDFTDGTLSQWATDIVTVMESLCKGDVILIGSSMGGWASLLAAIEQKERVKALVLINPAPDFTEKLTRAKWGEAEERALKEQGVVYEPSGYEEPYAYSKILMDDGKARQILDAPIPLTCPIRILHGAEDPVVPPEHSRLIVEAVKSEDVTYNLIKGGDHRLSRDQDLVLLAQTLNGLTEAFTD